MQCSTYIYDGTVCSFFNMGSELIRRRALLMCAMSRVLVLVPELDSQLGNIKWYIANTTLVYRARPSFAAAIGSEGGSSSID